jgi:hypothetical protein
MRGNMARQQAAGVLENAAVSIGRALGTIAKRVDAWKKDRAQITADINQVIDRAQAMLAEVAQTPTPNAIGTLGEIAHVDTAPRRGRSSGSTRTARPRTGAGRATRAARTGRPPKKARKSPR